MQKTTMLKKETANASRKWYLIDATDLILGRLGVFLADTLRGKNKPTFTPNVDCGDYVIVINSKNVKLSGNKAEKENWYNHSGYMGGLRTRNGQEMITNYSEELIRRVVKGMLPKNRLSRQILKKLFIYTSSEHPHSAQKPEVLTMNNKNNKGK